MSQYDQSQGPVAYPPPAYPPPGQAYPPQSYPPPAQGYPAGHQYVAPPPAGYPMKGDQGHPQQQQQVPVETKNRGDGFCKGCCAALCCCCMLDACF